MLSSLARLIHRRRRRVLAGAVLLVIVAGVLGGPVAGLLDSDDDFDAPSAQAVQAREAITEATGASAAPDVIALVRLGAPADSAQGQEKLRAVAAAAEGPEVARVDAYGVDGASPPELVSKDGRSSYVAVTLRNDADSEPVVDRLEEQPGVVVGGPEVIGEQVGTQVQEDLARAELLAFPLLFLVSLVVFRGLIAALLPLAIGMTTVLSTFLLMRVVNAIEPMSIFALNLIIGLGLGLAIDYSLFIVTRFREELERGQSTADALVATLRTAGRTVLFSAATVAAALAALLVFDQRFLFSMGAGGSLVTLVAAAVSLIILPALLAVLGPRVNALAPARWRAATKREALRTESGFWYRLSRWVMRRPGAIAATTAVLLIVLGLPFTQIQFTGVDASVLGTSHSARVVDDALRTEFPPNRTTPILVAAHAPRDAGAEVDEYAERLADVPGILAVEPPEAAGDALWRIAVVAPGRRLDDSAKDAVEAVRAVPAPFAVDVGGSTAEFLDQQTALADKIPLALAILVHDDARHPVPDDGLGRAPGQDADHEPAHAQRGVRDPRADLPGRPPGGPAGLHGPGRPGELAADPALRDRLRALHRLRGLPAHADQGGARRRIAERRGGRRRVAADRPDRDRRGDPLLHRDRRVRDVRDDLHQAARARHRARRADRRDDRARAARAVADAPARRVELVGSAAAGAPARADRALRSVTVAPPHPFDADTALEEAGPLRWRAWAPEHWFVGRGPNGGYLAAVAARAAEAAAGRPLRSLALHFAAAPAVGPLDVAATLERDGRSYSAVTVRIEQDGAPMTLALATLGDLPDTGPAWDAAPPPPVTPLAETEPIPPDSANVPAFMQNYDLRWGIGQDGDVPGSGGWMRTREPRLLDAPLVAAMCDAWAPAAFVALGRFVAAPTLDLTIHIRRPLPPAGMDPEDYVLCRFTSRLAVGGVWEEDGALWTPAGELIAQSRQLALARELPA